MTLNGAVNVYVTPQGYQSICLGGRHELLHRWIAQQEISNPEDKPCVNHIDGDKLNNNISNLEWVTYSENELHAHRTGLKHGHHPKPSRRKPVAAMKNGLIKHFGSVGEASLETGVLRTSIANCLAGRAETAGGYRWQYR